MTNLWPMKYKSTVSCDFQWRNSQLKWHFHVTWTPADMYRWNIKLMKLFLLSAWSSTSLQLLAGLKSREGKQAAVHREITIRFNLSCVSLLLIKLLFPVYAAWTIFEDVFFFRPFQTIISFLKNLSWWAKTKRSKKSHASIKVYGSYTINSCFLFCFVMFFFFF